MLQHNTDIKTNIIGGSLFRSKRPVSTIFQPYIMSNGTYERIKIFCDTLPLSPSLLISATLITRNTFTKLLFSWLMVLMSDFES